MITRIIHTRFWEDGFICELQPLEKLTFLYFLTNSKIGLTGIYELPDKYILFDLGISADELAEIKKKFQKADKIYFKDHYIAIKNAKKYNDYSKGNANQKKAFNRELQMIPNKIKDYLLSNGFQLVEDYLATSRGLYINNKSKIINNKSKNKNHKTEDINKKPEVSKEVLEKAKEELYEKLNWN